MPFSPILSKLDRFLSLISTSHRFVTTAVLSLGILGYTTPAISDNHKQCDTRYAKLGAALCDGKWTPPSLTTTDGLTFPYHASGDYILMTVPGVDGIEIQGRFVQIGDMSWLQAVALQVGSDKVEVKTETLNEGDKSHLLTVKVNRKSLFPLHQWHSVNDTRRVLLPGGGSLFVERFMGRFGGRVLDPIEITLIWPFEGAARGYQVKILGVDYDQHEAPIYANLPPFIKIDVKRPAKFSGGERGLLGNNDDNPANDIMRRDGQVLGIDSLSSWTVLYALFGSDWLAKPNECLFGGGCVEPSLPSVIGGLKSEKATKAELACSKLAGWYKETCKRDAGHFGNLNGVRNSYQKIKGFGHMSRLLETPKPSSVYQYSLQLTSRLFLPESSTENPVYRQAFEVINVIGSGRFLVVARPPRGATVSFANSEKRWIDSTSTRVGGSLTVDCRNHDPMFSAEQDSYLPIEGSIQLWSLDPDTGSADRIFEEASLSCASSAEGK